MTDAAEGVDELSRLLDISRAFKLSKALNLAGKLGLVTRCAQKPDGLTLGEVCSGLGWSHWASGGSAAGGWPEGVRGPADYLDLLVSMRVLARTDPGPEARYTPHPSSARYLLDSSPDCITGILALNNDRSAPLFGFLEDALRCGQVPRAAREQVPDITDTFSTEAGSGHTAGGAEHFALGMLGASRANFECLARAMDFTAYRHVVDIGGSMGACCVALCTAHPHLTATTCDLPAVRGTAQAYVAQHHLTHRVQVRDLDFFGDEPFPEADVVIMGMVLHDWGLQKKRMLIAKAKAALRPGGAFIAVENLVDDNREVASSALASSLNMLVEFGHESAFDFSFKEFDCWTSEAGFTSTQCTPLVGNFSAAVAFV